MENEVKDRNAPINYLIMTLKNELEEELEELEKSLIKNQGINATCLSHFCNGNYQQKKIILFKEGITLLEKNNFLSCENFQSVKYLIEVENYLKKYFKKSIYFSGFRKLILKDVLIHAEIEIKLDALKGDADVLYKNDCKLQLEYNALINSINRIRKFNKEHFIDKSYDYQSYQAKVLDVILQNKNCFKRNVSFNALLLNFIAFFLTGGLAFIVNKAVNGHLLFFNNKDISKKINELENKIIDPLLHLKPTS